MEPTITLAFWRAKTAWQKVMDFLSGHEGYWHVDLIACGRSFTSTIEDGVCFVKRDGYDPSQWTMIEVPVSDDELAQLCNAENEIVGKPYDYIGLLRWIGWPLQSKSRYFCSEAVAEVLQEAGVMDASVAPFKWSPNDIYRWAKTQR